MFIGIETSTWHGFLSLLVLCHAIISLNPRRRGPSWQSNANLGVVIHSLAFGGRGYFVCNRPRAGRVFDSTLGFPGEGPGDEHHDSIMNKENECVQKPVRYHSYILFVIVSERFNCL